jgi:hypothetical protein
MGPVEGIKTKVSLHGQGGRWEGELGHAKKFGKTMIVSSRWPLRHLAAQFPPARQISIGAISSATEVLYILKPCPFRNQSG